MTVFCVMQRITLIDSHTCLLLTLHDYLLSIEYQQEEKKKQLPVAVSSATKLVFQQK